MRDEITTRKYQFNGQLRDETGRGVANTTITAICMLLYIWFRFKRISRFATSAVLALLHDHSCGTDVLRDRKEYPLEIHLSHVC